MRLATWHMIHQSGFASPGKGRNVRCLEIHRSELVTVPSFSPHAAAGNNTCATLLVSVLRTTSDDTTNSQRSNAARTLLASGRLTTGLVAMIHTALTLPA